MAENWKNFESSPFVADSNLVDLFVENFDGNRVHLPGNSNEILPTNTVPGLMVISLAARAVLKLDDFREILCARGFKIKFQSPVFRGDELMVRGRYYDQPHRERSGVVFRINECDVLNASNQKIVMTYEITQLLRMSKTQ